MSLNFEARRQVRVKFQGASASRGPAPGPQRLQAAEGTVCGHGLGPHVLQSESVLWNLIEATISCDRICHSVFKVF